MAEFKDNMYMVVKQEDILKYLSSNELLEFREMLHKINECRQAAGKQPNKYHVCNVDEDYFWKVIEDILDGEDEKKGVKKPWLFKQGRALQFKLKRLRITVLIRLQSTRKKTS